MRRPLVAGNWKMNGNRESITTLVKEIIAGLGSLKRTEVAVCPPYPYIPLVAELLRGSPVVYGGQDVCDELSGAFTGEVSGQMLKDLDCTYAIVGHSERRNVYGESDGFTAGKFAAAQRDGLIPILCVGELLEEREKGITEGVVGRQLAAVLGTSGINAFTRAVVAYEPVWAIGTGKTATPDQAQEVHDFIRKTLAQEDGNIAADVRILYGGSVKGANAAELFSQPDIDGGLIGGASLQAEEFLAICSAGENG